MDEHFGHDLENRERFEKKIEQAFHASIVQVHLCVIINLVTASPSVCVGDKVYSFLTLNTMACKTFSVYIC